MEETLTRAEIEARYDGEWIVIADPEVDDHLEVLRGRVVAHGTDRDEVYQRAIDLRLKEAAFLYTGRIPDDVAVIL